MNNLAPMKNCPGGGVQGNLNWMPGYMGILSHIGSNNIINKYVLSAKVQ